MKKRYLLGLLPFLLLTACSGEDDAIFPESATARIRAVTDSCAKVVMQSAYGWKMLYTPDPVRHGGYNVLMKFETDENVRVYTDFLAEETLSTYSFNASQGPMLCFDTQSALHYLSNPEIQPVGTGKKGEFEFVIQSISRDSLVFTGKKYGQRIVFYPAEQADWETRMAAFRTNIERLTPAPNAPYFRGLTMNQTAVNLAYLPESRSISYTYSDAVTREILTGQAGVYGTEEGVRFSPKIRVNGVVLDALKYNPTLQLFEANTPGVIGQLKYSHKPPFPFYNSIGMLKEGSNTAGLSRIPELNLSTYGTFLVQVLNSSAYMSEELSRDYPGLVLDGLKHFRLCWELEDDAGALKGPWISYVGSVGLDLGGLNLGGLDLGAILGGGSGGGTINTQTEYTVDYQLADTLGRAEGDQIKFTRVYGANSIRLRPDKEDDKFRNHIEGNAGFNTFTNFITDPAGFTVVPESGRVFVLVNLADSRRWIRLTK
ncbi:MAG: DUF4302 domain-containing protein [Culturomica sp.]|jgi:hypothetical protein|nr:DUF4302 domain-containing protein [Culturomica sp.]